MASKKHEPTGHAQSGKIVTTAVHEAKGRDAITYELNPEALGHVCDILGARAT